MSGFELVDYLRDHDDAGAMHRDPVDRGERDLQSITSLLVKSVLRKPFDLPELLAARHGHVPAQSMATIFRVYTLYRRLKTFFAIGSLLMLAGFIIGARFL